MGRCPPLHCVESTITTEMWSFHKEFDQRETAGLCTAAAEQRTSVFHFHCTLQNKIVKNATLAPDNISSKKKQIKCFTVLHYIPFDHFSRVKYIFCSFYDAHCRKKTVAASILFTNRFPDKGKFFLNFPVVRKKHFGFYSSSISLMSASNSGSQG